MPVRTPNEIQERTFEEIPEEIFVLLLEESEKIIMVLSQKKTLENHRKSNRRYPYENTWENPSKN